MNLKLLFTLYMLLIFKQIFHGPHILSLVCLVFWFFFEPDILFELNKMLAN